MQVQDLAPSAPLQGTQTSRLIGTFCSALERGRRGKRSKMVGTWVMYYEPGGPLLQLCWACTCHKLPGSIWSHHRSGQLCWLRNISYDLGAWCTLLVKLPMLILAAPPCITHQKLT